MLVLEKNLLYSIVRYGDSGRFVEIARNQGAGGATVFLAKGTASSIVLRALGMGEARREVVLVLAGEETARSIIKAAKEEKRIEGVSILIGNAGEEDMDTKLKMITVIVNSGYAEDVMAAARKAGATGKSGTVYKTGAAHNACTAGTAYQTDTACTACAADKADTAGNTCAAYKTGTARNSCAFYKV